MDAGVDSAGRVLGELRCVARPHQSPGPGAPTAHASARARAVLPAAARSRV